MPCKRATGASAKVAAPRFNTAVKTSPAQSIRRVSMVRAAPSENKVNVRICNATAARGVTASIQFTPIAADAAQA